MNVIRRILCFSTWIMIGGVGLWAKETAQGTLENEIQAGNFEVLMEQIDGIEGEQQRRYILYRMLGQACQEGRLDLVRLLISYGTPLWIRDYHDPPVHLVAESGNVKLMQLLLLNGASITGADLVNRQGEHVLASAARGGHLEMVEFLLDQGVSLHVTGERTPLYCACLGGNLDVLQTLLVAGLSLPPVGEPLDDLLLAAIGMDHKSRRFYVVSGQDVKIDMEIVKFLIDKGAKFDVHYADGQGHQLMHMAARIGNIEVVQWLIDQGVKGTVSNQQAVQPIHYAGMKGHLDMVKFLVMQGADLKAKDKHKKDVLSYAASEGRQDMVIYLLSNGFEQVDPASYSASSSPLRLACDHQLGLVKALVGAGFSVNPLGQRGRYNHLPIYRAVMSRHRDGWDVFQYLLEQGAVLEKRYYKDFLRQSAYLYNIDLLKFLVQQGVDIKEPVQGWGSILIRAIMRGARNERIVDYVAFLIQQGIDINQTIGNRTPTSGNTAIWWAVERHSVPSMEGYQVHDYGLDLVKLLVQTGKLDPEAGQRAYELAVQARRASIAEYLKSKGYSSP